MDSSYLTQLFGLEGRVAIVTGASRGLGRSMALALARAGARLCLVGRQANLDETQAELSEQGCDSIAVVCPLDDPDSAETITRACLERWGQIDILVNNAGTFLRKPAAEWTIDEWDQVLAVNLRFVFSLCLAAGRTMLERGSGKIINIASVLGFQGGLTVPAYSASRHGVLGLTKALANEWAAQGVNVNAIAPGYMDTAQNERLFSDPVRSRELMARIPAKRWGAADEIDGACLFLASQASNYMHGQVVIVDGGWLTR